MEYHRMVKQILDLLKKNEYWHETFEHEPVRTSEEAGALRAEYKMEQGAKALIMMVLGGEGGEDRPVMLVLPANTKLKNKRVRKLFKTKSVRFASRKEANKITKTRECDFIPIEFGGVPPFGNLFGLKVYVDPALLENEKIVFNAGDRRFSIGMKTRDYMDLVRPEVVRIT